MRVCTCVRVCVLARVRVGVCAYGHAACERVGMRACGRAVHPDINSASPVNSLATQ